MRLSAGEISYKEYEESVSDGGGGFVALGFIILFIIVFVIARRNGPTNIGHGGSSVADAIFWSSILGGGRSHGGGRRWKFRRRWSRRLLVVSLFPPKLPTKPGVS